MEKYRFSVDNSIFLWIFILYIHTHEGSLFTFHNTHYLSTVYPHYSMLKLVYIPFEIRLVPTISTTLLPRLLKRHVEHLIHIDRSSINTY